MLNDNIPQEVLDEKYIRVLIKAINDSRNQQHEHLRDRSFKINNGRYQDRWNYIFNNIEKYFNKNEFKCYVVDRCALWSFIVIYNIDSQVIYIIFKKGTFKNIKKWRDLYHYAKILNSINSRHKFIRRRPRLRQLSLFGDSNNSPSPERIYSDLEDMIYDIKDEVKWCVNILFTEDADGVNSISGNLATYDLDIFKTYDWNKYISPTIEEISDTKDIEADEVPPIDLKIREEKFKQDNKEEIVDEKENEDKDKKDKNEN